MVFRGKADRVFLERVESQSGVLRVDRRNELLIDLVGDPGAPFMERAEA